MTETEVIRRETTPLTLLEQALSKGVTADELTQWMDLEKRWRADQALQAYNEDFNKAQAEMPVVVKDAVNPQKSSRYARLEAVSKIVTPCMVRHGFAMSFSEADCPIEGSRRIVAKLRHKGGHSEEFHVDMPMDGKGAKGGDVMNGPQSLCSTLSYAQRRVTCMVWNLTVADSDADGETQEAVLNPEQLVILRTKFHDHFNAGIGNFPTVEALEKKFVEWLAAAQKTPDVTALEDIHSSLFPRAISTLDGKLRAHQAKGQANV